MKFNFINIFFLGLIINTVVMDAMETPKREPLPLTYQSLLRTLRTQTKITPNLLHILETNPDLKSVYETIKNPAELGLNQNEFNLLYDTLLSLDFNSFKVFLDLINAIKNQINLEYLKTEGIGLIEYVERKPLDGTPAASLRKFRGDLIRELLNLIKKNAFKEEISILDLEFNHKLLYIVFGPNDGNNRFYNVFRRFIQELEIGDLEDWDEDSMPD